MKQKGGGLSSAEKVLKILLAFLPHNQEMGTLELSDKLGLHKSTVSRLLHLLTGHQFLRQDPANKKYKLGKSAAEIGSAVIDSLNSSIVTIAQPYLHELCNALGESVALELLARDRVVLAYDLEGSQHIRFSFRRGERLPLHVAAGAKAILAFSSEEFVRSSLQGRLTRYTPKTITSPKALRAELEEIRRRGVAFDLGERYIDVYALAAPIFNHEKKPVAAVVIAGPDARMKAHMESPPTVALLKETAARISAQLLL
jgi:IclR family KDG regulon transcriptional repressor